MLHGEVGIGGATGGGVGVGLLDVGGVGEKGEKDALPGTYPY